MPAFLPKINDFFVSHGRVPMKEKIFFVQQLNIMVRSGISLSVGIHTLKEQVRNKKMKKIYADLEETVKKGELLSKGLEKYKKDFGELFINMIKSGEVSGLLENVLAELFNQMKKDHAVLSKVRGAMIYPSVVILGMIGVGTLMMVYVMPNLISVFSELNVQLPLATRILIATSQFVTAYGIFLLIALIAFIAVFIRFITWQKGKKIFHAVLLKTPIASQIIKKINLARFCRTFSALLKTDIAIIQTFETTQKVLGNQLYKDALEEAREKLKKGQRVEETLRPYSHLFPGSVLQMIAIGEETGSLDKILEQAAEFYEEDIDQTMTNFPSIIEPVLILILGVAVGLMAVSVIMPLYSLSQQL